MELTLLVGSPDFIWRDGGAELWRYRQDQCVTDFYLYADERGTRVRFIEQLNMENLQALSEPCLMIPE